MELFTLDQIAIDSATCEILKDVDETARKVNDLRPLQSTVVKAVLDELLGERVFSSNAIEGNTFTLRETIDTLRTGHIEIARRREATEVLNLGKAIEHLHSHLLNMDEPHQVDEFLGLHKILLRTIDDDSAGRLRGREVMIRGAKHQPPDHRYVAGLLERFFEQVRAVREVNTLRFATWVHWMITRIHPFVDGNGRMARLWQDLVLFRGRLTCAIIPPEARREYLDSLAAADDGDFNPLTQLVARRVGFTLDKYLSAQQKIDAVTEWARALAGETSAREAERRRLQYLRWQRRMEQVRYEFERCAASVTESSTELEIQLRPYEIINQETWESVRTGRGATHTWFFRLVFRRRRTYLTYIFFFGKHYWTASDTDQDRSEPRVCLLISEQASAGQEPPRLDEMEHTPLSIRELFVVDSELVRKRYDATRDQDVYDRDIDPTRAAQEFISDVLLLRMP